MAEEYFDIVDETNNPTGQKVLRADAHTKGLWHRTVHLYIFREQGEGLEFLVHLRAKTKDLHPNRWDTRFGGHVQSGQTVEQAIHSESKEEIGLDLHGIKLLKGHTRKHEDFPNNEFVLPFFLECDETPDLTFNDGEVQQVKWMTQDEIIKSKTSNPEHWSGSLEGFKKRCEEIQKKLKRS